LGDVSNQIFKTLEEAVMDAWAPIDEPAQASTRPHAPPVDIPSDTSTSYFTKPSPTTSNALANGSVMTPTAIAPSTERAPHGPNGIHQPSSENSTPPPDSHPPSTKQQAAPNKRRKPLYIREGGSIPAIRFLEMEFDAPAAHLPCGQASDSAHLDNERLRLVNLYKSKEIFTRVFKELPCR